MTAPNLHHGCRFRQIIGLLHNVNRSRVFRPGFHERTLVWYQRYTWQPIKASASGSSPRALMPPLYYGSINMFEGENFEVICVAGCQTHAIQLDVRLRLLRWLGRCYVKMPQALHVAGPRHITVRAVISRLAGRPIISISKARPSPRARKARAPV